MNKQDFIKIMKELKRITDELDKLRDLKDKTTLEKDFLGGYELGVPDLMSLVVDALGKTMDDKGDWIGYYVYELEWGKNYKKPIGIKGKKYKLKTLNDLYVILTLE